MEDDKLIECVRKYEFLHNLQHPKYMDTVRKDMAWKASEQLNQPAAACKQRWQGLRDAYRRALIKKKSKTGQTAKKIKKWKYEEEMSFVASFFVEKKTLESVQLTSDDEESQYKAGEFQNSNSDNEINSTDAVDVAASKNATDIEIQNEDGTIVCNKSSQPHHSEGKKAKAIKKAKILPEKSASAVLMSRLLDEQLLIPQQREHDELDRFFLNIRNSEKVFTLPTSNSKKQNIQFSFRNGVTAMPTSPETWDTSTNDILDL